MSSPWCLEPQPPHGTRRASALWCGRLGTHSDTLPNSNPQGSPYSHGLYLVPSLSSLPASQLPVPCLCSLPKISSLLAHCLTFSNPVFSGTRVLLLSLWFCLHQLLIGPWVSANLSLWTWPWPTILNLWHLPVTHQLVPASAVCLSGLRLVSWCEELASLQATT